MSHHRYFLLIATQWIGFLDLSCAFLLVHQPNRRPVVACSSSDDNNNILTDRLPTSVDDQIRQARACLAHSDNNNNNSNHRHCIRLLLPIIGATELDDWPGGARQQREAALPLVQAILGGESSSSTLVELDASDGVAALLTQGDTPAEDACAVLLPTAESVTEAAASLETQVGPERNLILVNPQWRRRSDFGGIFGRTDDKMIAYVESFPPLFSLTSLICEGESIRVLRTYPGPWRVYLREESETGVVDWSLVGTKDFLSAKPSDWQDLPENKRDGGLLFSYGQPTYQDIVGMLNDSPSYTPKGPAERAAVAFNFIKDSI